MNRAYSRLRPKTLPIKIHAGIVESNVEPSNPIFLAFFFSIFHAMGGAAIGLGFRSLNQDLQKSKMLFIWGGLMGVVPFLFDWVFLISRGQLLYGLIGPAGWVLSMIVVGLFWQGESQRLNGSALIALFLGGAALIMGILLAPYMIHSAVQNEVGLADWIFGGIFLFMFVVIGGSIAWAGLMTLLRDSTQSQEEGKRLAGARHKRG